MPKGQPPKKISSHFYRLKLGFGALLMFSGFGFASSFLQMDNASLWFDLAKITLGFLFGSGISAGLSR